MVSLGSLGVATQCLHRASSKSTLSMIQTCQACERCPSSVEVPGDTPQETYLLCDECCSRLQARALRPREWFNLAKRYGCSQALLHDDFYEEDGTASQPEFEVADPAHYLAPTLDEVCDTAETLLDYSITRWHIDDELVEKWKALSAADVVDALSRRFSGTQNIEVRSVVLAVSSIVGPPAAELVRHAWGQHSASEPFWELVQASAACLSFEEGYSRSEQALAAMPERVRREHFGALAFFRSPQTLSWIEANAGEPSTESWGHLAAASSFTWPKAEQWLKSGRPLSLIAIDALRAVANPRTPLLSGMKPSLGAPVTVEEMRHVLEGASLADPVPRVQKRIESLLSQLHSLARD